MYEELLSLSQKTRTSDTMNKNTKYSTITMVFYTALVLVLRCGKAPSPKATWEDRFLSQLTHSNNSPPLKEVMAGSQSRNWWRSHSVLLFTIFLLTTCSVCILIEFRTTRTGLILPTVNWALPCQSSIMKYPIIVSIHQSNGVDTPLPKWH